MEGRCESGTVDMNVQCTNDLVNKVVAGDQWLKCQLKFWSHWQQKDCIREVTRPLISILALIVLLRFSAKPNLVRKNV